LVLIFITNSCFTYKDRYASRPNLPDKSVSDELTYITLDSLFFIQVNYWALEVEQHCDVALRYLLQKEWWFKL